MKPKRIILVRHGESEGNVNRSMYGLKPDYALELTSNGVYQAKEAGQKLRAIIGQESAFFYVSPLWRTRMTFENIASQFDKEQINVIEEPRLREQEWGHLRNLEECKRVEEERDSYGTFYFRIPDGESAADVYDRVSDFFGTLHRDFAKDTFASNCVIVTHGMTIRLFLMKWFHWTVEQFEQVANPHNCALVMLEQNKEGKFELKTELTTHSVFHTFQRPIQF